MGKWDGGGGGETVKKECVVKPVTTVASIPWRILEAHSRAWRRIFPCKGWGAKSHQSQMESCFLVVSDPGNLQLITKVGKVAFFVQRKPSSKEMQMVDSEKWAAVHGGGRGVGYGRHPQHLLYFWEGISITSGLFLRSELIGSTSYKTIHWTKGIVWGLPSTLISTSLKSGFASNRVYWCLNNTASEKLGTIDFLDSLSVLWHLQFQSSSVKL